MSHARVWVTQDPQPPSHHKTFPFHSIGGLGMSGQPLSGQRLVLRCPPAPQPTAGDD